MDSLENSFVRCRLLEDENNTYIVTIPNVLFSSIGLKPSRGLPVWIGIKKDGMKKLFVEKRIIEEEKNSELDKILDSM